MFGIVTEVELKVNNNVLLEMDAIPLTKDNFTRIYQRALLDEEIEIKLARVDVTKPHLIELYLFRHTNPNRSIGRLTLEPRTITPLNRIVYKWLAPALTEVRFSIERSTGVALDWDSEHDRNQLMYESAEPLAKLYDPLYMMDDTFVLQEYFIPESTFTQWYDCAIPIYESVRKEKLISLLNTTIRYVHKDTDTIIPYATADKGMYAFVLYYRIRRSKEADEVLCSYQQRFISITLQVKGTFYLPYRHHYSDEQMLQAYPNIFAALKQKYDKTYMFTNKWCQRYMHPLFSNDYLTQFQSRPVPSDGLSRFIEEPEVLNDYELKIVSDHRTDSYRKLYADKKLRQMLQEDFLVNTFNIENGRLLYRAVVREVWDIENKTDNDIYRGIQRYLNSSSKSLPGQLGNLWKQIAQLRAHKQELTRETVAVVGKLGLVGHVQDYVSVGDHGKLVRSLRKALNMNGSVTVVHDHQSDDIPAVLERGSTPPFGNFVRINYETVGETAIAIADGSADLVTMNQGLHHLPQAHLLKFIREIYRILRPGGIFILREHDCSPENRPILDLAHSIFNAVTAVDEVAERKEIRAFRSILEWREIIESVGFVDTRIYDIQEGDVTKDEMMCFIKVRDEEHCDRAP